eukprot:TRINITY_DN63125_c1_g4_i1.p1 TRINITY_DN63125_c1_g4~~TRINITY_DN63125_c1_g4_i1.p1  ORF type:complete len:121 (+),score=4.64 TRINITY_DN63125_c1_g4_i1:139-501(+)
MKKVDQTERKHFQLNLAAKKVQPPPSGFGVESRKGLVWIIFLCSEKRALLCFESTFGVSPRGFTFPFCGRKCQCKVLQLSMTITKSEIAATNGSSGAVVTKALTNNNLRSRITKKYRSAG